MDLRNFFEFRRIIYIFLHISCNLKDFCWSLDPMLGIHATTHFCNTGQCFHDCIVQNWCNIYSESIYTQVSAAEYVIYLGILTTIASSSAEKHVKHVIRWNV